MVIVEHLVEWRLAGKAEVLEENLFQCHFVHHKSYMTWPGLEEANFCPFGPTTFVQKELGRRVEWIIFKGVPVCA
jgi:hypothetical protein